MNTITQDNQGDESPANDSSHSSRAHVFDSAFLEPDFLSFEQGFHEVFHTFSGAPYSSLVPKKQAGDHPGDGVFDERS